MKLLKQLTAVLLSLVLGITSLHAEENDAQEPSNTEEVFENGAEEEIPAPSSESEILTDREEENELPSEEETESEKSEEKTAAEETIEDLSEEEEIITEEEIREESVKEEENSETEEGYSIPECFEVHSLDKEGKKALKEHGMFEELETLEEGIDCAAHQVVLFAQDEDYAKKTAEIYHGTLLSFSLGIAVIELPWEDTVKDAVSASWTDDSLPLIEPDYLTEFEEPLPQEEQRGSGTLCLELPSAKTWESTVYDLFEKPDPYLKDPTASTYQWFHEAIGSYYAWTATMGSEDILVGVVDYSVNADHEELKGKVSTEDIGCGYYLGTGHGTGVAGTIAAIADNGKGGAGVAPNVRILSINIFKNTSTAKSSDIANAILKAAECEVDIINFSVGSRKYSFTEETAVNIACEKGIPFVAAAGNDGSNIQVFPAALDQSIAVAATDRNGLRASFSNYGSWITLSAPGASIRMPSSSWSDSSSRYATSSGTSFAAPMVTGALALYMSKNGKITPDQAKNILKSSCTSTSSSGMGYGILSLEKLFASDQAEPVIHVYDRDDNEITSFTSALPKGSYIVMESVHPGDQDLIAYTTDGSDVKVSGGKLTNGIPYDGTPIYVDDFPENSTIKIKALAISSFGAAGKKASLTIKTPTAPVVYKIKTVKLDHTSASLCLPDNEEGRGSLQLNTASLINTQEEEVDLDSVPHTWTTGNPAIASVDENGKVTALGKGSTTVKLKLLDGSGKTASCSIKVTQYAEMITISGQDAIAPGCSASYKATVLPSSANTRTVTWSLKEPAEGVTISSGGSVKVNKNAETGGSFTIQATAKDGSETIGEKTILIQPKATALKILTEDERAVYTSKGILKSISIFTSDLYDSAHRTRDEHIAVLTSEITGNEIPPVWKSSNTKVATVDQSGLVTAVGKGSATITCTANDGSGKKASVSISVSVPVSFVRLSPGNNTFLATGKSMNMKKTVSYGTAYGKPSKKEVSWSIESVIQSAETGDTDITEEVKAGKQIIISGNELRVKKALENLVDFSENTVFVTVKAESKDGTGYSDTMKITVHPAIEALQFAETEGSYYECEPDGSYTAFLYSQYPMKFEISSSNPKIAGAYIEYTSEKAVDFEYKKNGKYYICSGYQYRVRIYTYPDKTGTAAVTVKALDGSGKKATLKVRVQK